jgi:tetratricopeptide (TPR) repeat protein
MTPVNQLFTRIFAAGALACVAAGPVSLRADDHVATETKKANPSAESFETLTARAQTAMDANQTSEAIRLYREATRAKPTWSEGWWHLGTLSFDAGHFVAARDAFTNFVSVERKQPGPGFGMLGLCEIQLKHYPKALSAFEHSRKLGLGTNPDFIHTVLYHDGILFTLIGEPEIALQRFTLIANQIAAAHPDAPKDAVFADGALLDAFGIAALHLPMLPADVPADKAPLIRKVGHAQAQVALQDRVAAGEEFKELVDLYPSERGMHYAYGVFLLKENPPLAADEFKKEIDVAPSDAVARIQLALQFLENADYEQGLKYAREAVTLSPGNFIAHVACGRLWLALGKTDRALVELRAAVKLAPSSPDAHFALSQALSQAGESKDAARERAQFERLKAVADAADRR